MFRLSVIYAVFAVVVVLVILAAGAYFLYTRMNDREGFASPRARLVSAVAAEAFANDKNPSFAEVRRPLASVGGLDPVEFDDVRRLARRGQATPEAVQSVLVQ